MHYIKKLHLICFDYQELREIYEKSKKTEIWDQVAQKGLVFNDMYRNTDKFRKLVDVVIESGLKDKDEAEIFMSLLLVVNFYKDSMICFVLKDGIDPHKIKITNLLELISVVKENDLTDFAIRSNDGIRQFQLKRIKFLPTTKSLFDFIKEKIIHYGNNLGSVNMLFVLQGQGEISNEMFVELNFKLKELSFKTQAEILIAFNENNEVYVMNQVYPDVTTTRVPIQNTL